MDENGVSATRRSWHAVAERLLAGPQHRERGTIRLRIVPGGFGQVAGAWRGEGAELVGPTARVPLVGTVAEVAARAGLVAGVPEDLYGDHVGPRTPRRSPFWNAPFGALRAAAELPDADAVAAWFAEGRAAARA
jgi:hypothetical protein